MRPPALIALLWLGMISCEHKSLRKLFNQSTYDQQVIESLPLYDSLKNIIVSNIDTIFKFRNSKHLLYHGDTGKETQEDADFYIFNYSYDTHSKSIDELRENIPEFIYPSIDKLFKKLGQDKVRGFGLWPDSTIEIAIKSIYREDEDANVSHTLVWKKTFSKDTDLDILYRDTIIAPEWTYQINVEKHSD